MDSPTRVKVSQDRETTLMVGHGAGGFLRFAYARAADTQAADQIGQDYLTFAHDGQRFCFALCDGVGQSYFGDIAARFLGDHLLDWLWTLAGDGLPDVAEALEGFLNELVTGASDEVQNHALPSDLPDFLREVLEDKRSRGSETTFACGRIDLPPAAGSDGGLLFAWMGDSRLRLWGPEGERTAELGHTFQTHQRWSSLRGPVGGAPNLYIASLPVGGQALRLVAYSDGLQILDDYAEPPTSAALEAVIEHTTRLATSDDVAYLEFQLLPDTEGESDDAGNTDGQAGR